MFDELPEIMFGLNQVMNRYGNSNDYIGHKRKIYKMISEKNSGYVSCIDITDGTYKRVLQHEFNETSNYIGVNTGKKYLTDDYICDSCSTTIKGKLNFSQHQKYFCVHGERLQHPNTFKLSCSFCGMSMNKTQVLDHERACKKNPDSTHRKHNMKKSVCKFCGLDGQLNIITRHENYYCKNNKNKKTCKSLEIINCKYCNKEFTSKGIQQHERKCKLQVIH